MKALGLVGILIAVGIGVWWVSTMLPAETVPQNDVSGYENVIDAAGVAADQMEAGISRVQRVPVYEGINVPINLAVLDLSNKSLSGSLKAEIRLLTELKELNLSSNNFTGVPAEVGQLSQLRILNLANNPLTGLPHELGNLKNLEVLDLRDTNASEVDLEIIKEALSPEVTVLTSSL